MTTLLPRPAAATPTATAGAEQPTGGPHVYGDRPFDGVSVLTFWLCLVFLIPASQVVPQVGAAGKPSVLFGYGLLVAWLATRFLPGAVYRIRQPVRWFLGLYLVSLFISYAAGILRGLSAAESTATDRSLIVQVSMVAAAVVALDGIPSRKRFDDLMMRLIGLAAVAGVIGFLQFFFTWDVAPSLTLPGINLNGQEPIVTIDNRNGFNRVASTTGHALEYGAVMAMILPIAVHYVLHDKPGARRRWLVAATFFIAMGVPTSISRTSTVAVALMAAGVAIGWSGKMLWRASIVGIISLMALRAAVPSLLGSILSLFTNLEDDLSITARTSDYPIVFRFIRERPIFGRGPGTYGPPDYLLLDNQVLSTTVNNGIVGLVALLALFLVAIAMLRRTVWTSVHDETRHLAVAMAVSLLVAMVVLYFADMLFFMVYTSTSFLFFGLAGSLWRLRDDRSRFDLQPRWYLKEKLRADRVRRERPLPFDRPVTPRQPAG